MGVQPSTPQSDLVVTAASTDTAPPTIAVRQIAQNVVYGTAQDRGGVVASIEVSEDSGKKWSAVTQWDYLSGEWRYIISGGVNVVENLTLLVRATDDSGNMCKPAIFVKSDCGPGQHRESCRGPQ